MKIYTEVRYEADKRQISGTALTYGDRANIGSLVETFERNSIQLDDVVMLNVQHNRGRPLARFPDGGLALELTSQGLEVRATLPETTEANDTIELIRNKVLTGLSIEFRAVADRVVGTTRRIQEAIVSGIAVVDRPAYPDSTITARWTKQAIDNDFRRLL